MAFGQQYVVLSGALLERQQDATAAAGAAGSGRYESHPGWTTTSLPRTATRRFEAADTTRLNEAHWLWADDVNVNVWLTAQLSVLRQRATYEARNNPILQGVVRTFADDVVGQDGPTLQVQSDDDAYNEAVEQLWRDWFAAPTPRPNRSGTAILKLWCMNLWKCGEFLATIGTVSDADGPVKMRIQPTHPRRLTSPAEYAGDTSVCMGIRFDGNRSPSQYYIAKESVSGEYTISTWDVDPYPPDLVIHEFLAEEEDQARGIPFANSVLPAAADLRDYDAQVQDAARQMADQSALLYTDHPDAELWTAPETVEVERRTVRMAPPGWKFAQYNASQPPVQYPEYRAERHREFGRPVGMPLLMVRLDASNHNYSSARLDTQIYRRSIAGIQTWLSGSDKSYGTLNRLVDELIREARFSIPVLQNRPDRVVYQWTWPTLPHVDPMKEASAEQLGLVNRTITLSDALASRGRDLQSHVAILNRERQAFDNAEIPHPKWMDAPASPTQGAFGQT